MELTDILKTEYSEEFDKLRKNAMLMSYYKYGPLNDNYGKYKCIDPLKSLEMRMEKYRETKNKEYLVDIANFAMIEFMCPSLDGAFYKPTDSDGSPGIHGFSINEIRNFDK